jgi:hypothetical protein
MSGRGSRLVHEGQEIRFSSSTPFSWLKEGDWLVWEFDSVLNGDGVVWFSVIVVVVVVVVLVVFVVAVDVINEDFVVDEVEEVDREAEGGCDNEGDVGLGRLFFFDTELSSSSSSSSSIITTLSPLSSLASSLLTLPFLTSSLLASSLLPLLKKSSIFGDFCFADFLSRLSLRSS